MGYVSLPEGIEVKTSEATVDGRNPAPVEVGSLPHYLQCFIHPWWCRISCINSECVHYIYTSLQPFKSKTIMLLDLFMISWIEYKGLSGLIEESHRLIFDF